MAGGPCSEGKQPIKKSDIDVMQPGNQQALIEVAKNQTFCVSSKVLGSLSGHSASVGKVPSPHGYAHESHFFSQNSPH